MNPVVDPLFGLNSAQREAVEHTEGPLLVLAGAGAGKTKVITHRILNLVNKGVAAEQIIAVTFTNKAAKEMRERIGSLISSGPVPHDAALPFTTTFHALGVYLLRIHGHHLGIPKAFTIYDRSDSLKIIKDALVADGHDPKQYEPRTILGVISKQKGAATTVSEYASSAVHPFGQIVASTWEGYEKRLRDDKALDFDDLLVKAVHLLAEHEEVRSWCHRTWKYVHIDEYQDTNIIQYEMTKLLLGTEKNICAVGDVDQNIYTWRGATIDNILRFEEDFPGAKLVTLEQNYRSTKTILDIANTSIKKNSRRIEKNLFTENDDGDQALLYGAYDEHDEGRFIIEMVESLHASGVPYSSMAVLYRTNFQSRVLEDTFLYHSIPYQLVGTKFFERKEVKDVLSYIRAALNPDSTTDIARIANTPARGIGKVTLLKMLEKKTETLSNAMQERVHNFYRRLEHIREGIETKICSEAMKITLETSQIEEYYLERKTEEDLERLQNVRELVTLAKRYDSMEPREGMEKLLEEVTLASDQDEHDEKSDAVTLMTVHAAKGLEFDYVFVTGLEEGLFPIERMDEGDDPEEERRLFYVAVTRAGKRLFLSYTSSRTIYGTKQANIPSEFLTDIDPGNLTTLDDTSLPTDNGGGKIVYLE